MIRLTVKCDGAGCGKAVAIKAETGVPGWNARWARACNQTTGRLRVEMSMVAPEGWQVTADRRIICPECRLRRILARPMLEEPAAAESES